MSELTSIDLINKCPKGTKLWLLNLGNLEVDEGWLSVGGNASTKSNPNPTNKRRKLVMLAALIEHPTEGLILFETGSGKDYPEVWGAPINDLFARVDYVEDHELPAAIKKTGHDIKDIKAIVMGHLHLDHAGGLKDFYGTKVPIYVHELELKNAYYSIATGYDRGVYLPHYMDFDLNWQTFSGDFLELAPGINVRHSPGHTVGLCIMQVNMPKSGTWIFTTDQYHVSDGYHENAIQGWLARDHAAWQRSNQMIHMLQKRTNAKMVFGHCAETLQQYNTAPHAYE